MMVLFPEPEGPTCAQNILGTPQTPPQLLDARG